MTTPTDTTPAKTSAELRTELEDFKRRLPMVKLNAEQAVREERALNQDHRLTADVIRVARAECRRRIDAPKAFEARIAELPALIKQAALAEAATRQAAREAGGAAVAPSADDLATPARQAARALDAFATRVASTASIDPNRGA